MSTFFSVFSSKIGDVIDELFGNLRISLICSVFLRFTPKNFFLYPEV